MNWFERWIKENRIVKLSRRIENNEKFIKKCKDYIYKSRKWIEQDKKEVTKLLGDFIGKT